MQNALESQRNRLLVILFACVLLRAILVFRADVNWDEFYFLSLVYQHEAGELTTVLQTLHVHFFKWLPAVSKNEVYQVLAARLVMSALAVVTLICIYRIARCHGTQNAALASVIGYCSFSYVLDHGTSFRADTIVVTLLMVATLLAFLRRNHFAVFILAGMLIGVAGLVTIKAVFFAPLIGLVLLGYCMSGNFGFGALFNSSLAFLAAIATFIGIYFLHESSFADPPISDSVNYLTSSIDKTLLDVSIFPQAIALLDGVTRNFTVTFAIALGMFIVIRNLISSGKDERAKWLAAAGLCVPLLTVCFYRNSFAYYYILILAPACVLIAPAYDWVKQKLEERPGYKPHVVILLLLLVMQLGINGYKSLQRTTDAQVATLDVVHKMFPEPVSYIDRNSMVSSFNKQGFFMSSWGFENYHQNASPIFRKILESEMPKFLIANIKALDLDNSEIDAVPAHRRLLPGDEAVLRDNFIKHWGKIYIAGKRFINLMPNETVEFEILVEGIYTYQSGVPSLINREKIIPGGKVFLKQGRHTLQPTNITNEITLRFGENLYQPETPAPDTPIYFGL